MNSGLNDVRSQGGAERPTRLLSTACRDIALDEASPTGYIGQRRGVLKRRRGTDRWRQREPAHSVTARSQLARSKLEPAVCATLGEPPKKYGGGAREIRPNSALDLSQRRQLGATTRPLLGTLSPGCGSVAVLVAAVLSTPPPISVDSAASNCDYRSFDSTRAATPSNVAIGREG